MDQVQLDDEESFQIQVEVCDPIIKDGIQKYVVYTFKGVDKQGSFEVLRRYNDFDVFRTTLQIRWPGCYIPPLPQKKAMGNMDQKFIEERRHYLDLFVRKLATFKHLWYSEEADLFKRNPMDIEKILTGLHKLSVSDIVYRYENCFKEFSGKEINQEIMNKINTFQLYLKKIQPLLEQFQESAKKVSLTKQANQENMVLLLDYLMPEYEKNCLSEYVVNPENRMVFQGQAQELLIQIKQQDLSSGLDDLYLNIKIENREITALLEAYQQKERYEQLKISQQNKLKELQNEKRDVESGKTTLKSIFKQNKEEHLLKLQTSIDQTQKEIESLNILCDMMTIILGYVEINKFKIEKEQKYFNMLKSVGKYQIDKSKLQVEYWQTLLKNHMLMEV